MWIREFHRCQRGTSTLELTLMMPAVVFVMLFLIGMGHALITRQHAVVAARFAATYHGINGRAPSAQLVSDAASNGSEAWRLSGRTANAGGEAFGGLGGGIGGVAGVISSIFGSFVGSSGQGGRIGYTAFTTPNRGLLARLYQLGDATGQYQMISGTWHCKGGDGGGYLSLILSKVPIPGLSSLTGGSCCRPYQPR